MLLNALNALNALHDFSFLALTLCSAARWSGAYFVLFKHKMSPAEMGQLQHLVSTTPFADTLAHD